MFKKALFVVAAAVAVSAQDNDFFDDAAFDAAFDDAANVNQADDREALMEQMFQEIDNAEAVLGEPFLERRMTACLRSVRVTLVRNAEQIDQISEQLAQQWSVDVDQARNAYSSNLLVACNQNIEPSLIDNIISGRVPSQAQIDALYAQPKVAQTTLSRKQSERLSKVIQIENEEGNTYGREAMQPPIGVFGSKWGETTKFVWMLVTFALIFIIASFGVNKLKQLESLPADGPAPTNRKKRRYEAKHGIVNKQD